MQIKILISLSPFVSELNVESSKLESQEPVQNYIHGLSTDAVNIPIGSARSFNQHANEL
jgi:hypothetical protein